MLDKIKYKETSTKCAILFVGHTNLKGGIIMLKFQNNDTTIIATFEDFILTTYVIIDELYHRFAPSEVRKRSHVLDAKLSDSEIITIALCGELVGIDSENAWFSSKERSAIVSQKFSYCCQCASAPGVSLIIRKLMKGTR